MFARLRFNEKPRRHCNSMLAPFFLSFWENRDDRDLKSQLHIQFSGEATGTFLNHCLWLWPQPWYALSKLSFILSSFVVLTWKDSFCLGAWFSNLFQKSWTFFQKGCFGDPICKCRYPLVEMVELWKLKTDKCCKMNFTLISYSISRLYGHLFV